MPQQKNFVTMPAQHQNKQPGIESLMNPLPQFEDPNYKGSEKLKGKNVLITGGDSGIGRAVSIAFAKEGANIAIAYLDEEEDANETKQYVEKEGVKCVLLPGDLSDEQHCKDVVQETVQQLGSLQVLVNNVAQQYPQQGLEYITAEQLEKTFRINIFSYFHVAKAALSQSLVQKGIRVNGVAPGPIWTPLIPSSFDEKKVSQFGSNVPMQRPGQPYELAPAYVYLASGDSSYITGQMIHVNGGVIVNG